MLAACYLFGWFTMLTDDYGQLGRNIAAGAGFVSNIVLLLDRVSYFDLTTTAKPLLHLWSLGIEEQFYLFWPFLLWVGHKRSLPPLLMILLIGILSFAWNLMSIGTNPHVTYYSPLTRFWELMCGSLLAWVMVKGVTPWASIRSMLGERLAGDTAWIPGFAAVAGLLLVGYGFFYISEKGFPGMAAVVPVLGTMLVIAAGATAWPNRILSHRLLMTHI
ncbi:MAG TPA: acyltransferase [Dongiaceae bacterium]|nr:acyltransferase [Dongiaceae bacterium]